MSTILVTGGTGVLGQALVKLLSSHHINFLIGSRTPTIKNYDKSIDHSNSFVDHRWIKIDLMKTETTDEFNRHNIDTIVHLASLPMKTINGQPADVILTKNLLNSIEKKKNFKHLIYISIVGIDRIPSSYYKAKLECEYLIEKSGLPYSILRATQFHELVDALATKLLKLPICFVPGAMKVQPIQTEAVAAELVDLINGSPTCQISNIGGKRIYTAKDIVYSLLEARNEKKLVINVPVFGTVLQGFVKGYNTCDRIAANSITWQEYLAQRYHQ